MLRRVRPTPVALIAAFAGLGMTAHLAVAQPAPQTPPNGQPAAQPTPSDPKGTPAKPGDELGPGDSTEETRDRLREALAPQPGGLTPDSVARAASSTSPSVRSKQAELEGAEGQSEQALVQFFPRLSFAASYTRLSEVEQGSFGGGGSILGSLNAGPVTVGPCPQDPATQCVIDSGGLPVQATKFSISFPVILDNISFTAGLVVPISDYFLRSVQGYSAAQHNEEALKLQVEAQELQAAADSKIVFLQWIQAKGQTVVARMAVEDAEKQVADAKVGITVQTASNADLMRVEARLAQAQFQAAEASSVETTAEQRLRIVMHIPDGQPVAIGIDVFTAPPPPTLEALDALVAEGIRNRTEIRALEEQRASLDDVSSATTASYLPRLDAFADATLARPNQRITPATEEFNFTWDLGLRLTWTVNDTFSTIGSKKLANSRTAQVSAQRDALIDAVRVEVTAAYADLAKAQPSIEAADKGVIAAEETLRVTKKLFAFGKATGTQVVDAETEVTSARLRMLAAHVNLLAAAIRLEHATGRDKAKSAPAAPPPSP
ncbi:MAG: TolC family protein [Polyangiaceae bacterium]